jgi:hypothetical protein
MDKRLHKVLSTVGKGQGRAREVPTDSLFVGVGAKWKDFRKHTSCLSLSSWASSRAGIQGTTSLAHHPGHDIDVFWGFGTAQGESLQYHG